MKKQKKEKADARKAKFEDVTRYLNNFRMWDITEWDGNDKVVKEYVDRYIYVNN